VPEPKLIISQTSPPGEGLRLLGNSLFNLFPNWEVVLMGEVDSTNAEARRLAEEHIGGEAWKRVILAEFQSEGRGRMGRTWIAPKGSSLMATASFPQTFFKPRQSLIPLAAACWLIEGFERLGMEDVRVKWPNDILVRGRKICGILCETTRHGVLIGFGVNVTQEEGDLPTREANLPQATSLAMELPEDRFHGWYASALTLMGSILENLENQRAGEWILQEYQQRCVSLGESVAFKDYERGSLVGTAEGFDDSGALIVDVAGIGQRRVTTPIE